MNKVFRILVFVIILLGALGKEAQQRYFSSPSPDPQRGRTVEVLRTDGGTIYVTRQTDRLFWGWFAVFAVVFVTWILWPTKGKTNDSA